MSDQGEKTCPLCAEEMDLTDQQLKPCKCGYQVCVWCWHHIMEMAEKDETEGRCPACRSPYNKEKIVGTAANCEKMVSLEKKLTSRKGKSKTADSRKQLSSVRVVQRNLVYIVGLPLSLADEDLLQRKEYFAQYGKVLKVSMSRTAAGATQQFANNTCSVYITYSKEEEAVRCIQSVHGFILDGRPLRACFGTTKYCHAWLRSVSCTNPDCLYLHEIGSQEDSFTKDEVITAYTRVQQITGAITSMQRRSGSVLPPPADDYCNNSSASAGKPFNKTATNNSATNARGSPPNSSSGRSAALPAGALWGTRALNNQLPPATAPSSNGLLPASAPSSNGLPPASAPSSNELPPASAPSSNELPPASAPSSNGLLPASAPSSSGPLKTKAEICSPLTCSTAVADNSQVLSLPAEAGKKVLHSKESGTSQEKGKIDTLEPVEQYVGADDATYSSEKPDITIRPASSFMNNQLHSTPSLKEKDIHLITSSSATNISDSPLMSNGPTLPKDPYDATDVETNLRSDFSSFSIDRRQESHDTYDKSREPSPSQMNGKSVISADDFLMSRQTSDLRLETQAQGIHDTTPEMEDDLLSFNAQRHRDPEVILKRSYSSSPSFSSHSSGQLKGYSLQFANGVAPITANTQTFDQRADSVLQPSIIGELPNGYPENVFSSASKYLGSTDDTYYLSNEGKRTQMDRFEGETATEDHSSTAERGENNIISNILSMDFDPWNESLASQNLVKLLGAADNQQGSRVSNSRKLQSSNQSRFSFAREEEPMNPSADSRSSLSYIDISVSHRPLDQVFPHSRSYQADGFGTRNGFSLFNNQEANGFADNYSHLSSQKLSVSRSQMAAPPGFSAPNRAPPPGFAYEKMEQNFSSLSGTRNMFDTSSLLRNEYHAPSTGNINSGDIEFMDPAILAVGKGRVQNGFNVPSLDMSPSFPPQPSAFENDARLQLLMQRSLSLHQNQRFTDNGDNFLNDAYGISSRVVEQTLANNLSPFSRVNLPQGRNSVMSNGQWDGWNGAPSGNDLAMAELLRSERLGYNKFFNGYEESMFRMPNSGELYNRTFGI
ncbi:unnamed protein product [Withania somnifera]